MKRKVVIFICILLILAALATALPPPPPPPASPGSSSSSQPAAVISTSTSTPASNQTTTNTSQTTNQQTSIDSRLDQVENKVQSLENRINLKLQIPQSTSPIVYFIFLLIINILIIGAVIYLFLNQRNKKQKIIIPESIKNYVRANLQKGYQENQIRQSLTTQGWKPEQIDQIFKEV